MKSPADGKSRTWARLAATGAVGVVLAVVAVAYVVGAVHRAPNRGHSGTTVRPAVDLDGKDWLLFRSTTVDSDYGQVAMVPADAPTTPRAFTGVTCERVYAANGTVLCLTADRGVLTTYSAKILDSSFHLVRAFDLSGAPSRARLSVDGRMASWTVFVYGDSYTSVSFSTRTSIYDTHTGDLVPNLETFAITKDGASYQAADVNFWGVTFTADDNTFYATMATAGHTYLVQGDLAARSVRTLTGNVECPSLSPDGTRLVFKKVVSTDQRAPWRLFVLDLATMSQTQLAGDVSVDDQAMWLDDHTVAYALPSPTTRGSSDVWQVPSDGSGTPTLLMKDAFSPATTGTSAGSGTGAATTPATP